MNLALTRNPGVVLSSCYGTPITGTPNSGMTSAGTRWFLLTSHTTRVRQTGSVVGVTFFAGDFVNGITDFRLQLWRKNQSGRYDQVSQTDNLVSRVAFNSVCSVYFAPIAANEGDYLGFSVTSNGNSNHQVYFESGLGGTTYYTTTAPSTTGFAWASVEGVDTQESVRMQLLMQAPHVIGIGDSLMAGHPSHFSFLETTDTTLLGSCLPALVAEALGLTWQNMGVGSQTSTQIAGRFTQDCIDMLPRIALVCAGANDFGGAVTYAQYQANWTTMLGACVGKGIIPVVCLRPPTPSGNNTYMATRDAWQAWLVNTCAQSYPTAIVVNADAALGQFRAGGTAGNLWDLQSQYDADGTHPTTLGYVVWAQLIVDTIRAALHAAAGTLTPGERDAVADALLDRIPGIETNATLRQAMRIMAAVLAGKVSGAGSGIEHFTALDGTTSRVEVAVDLAGNRSSVNYTA